MEDSFQTTRGQRVSRPSWQPGPAGTPPGSDRRVKQQSSARRGHPPPHKRHCPFWPQLIRSFVSGKPTELSARKVAWNFLSLQLLSRLASGAAGPQGGPRGAGVRRRASGSAVQTLQSTSSGCLVPFASQPFWPTACLLVISLLTSVIIHEQAQHLREGVLL